MHRRGHNNMGFDDFLNTYNNPQDAMNDFLSPTIDNYNSTNYMSSALGSPSNTSFDAPNASKQVPNLDSQNRNVGMNAKEIVAKNLNAGALTNPSSTSYSTNNVPAPSVSDTNILPIATGALPETMGGQSPIETTSAVADETKWTDKVDIGNVLGAGMMVGSNLMASKNLDDSIDDINEGLDGITGMISTQNIDTLNEIGSIEQNARNTIDASADSANLRLGQALDSINQSNISTGAVRRMGNEVRKKLNKNLDATAKNVFAKSESAIDRVNVSNRASIDKIRGLQEQLKGKKKQAQKDKRMAQWGTAIGVGSLISDVFLPGSGQVLRTGFNAYSKYS